MTWFSSCCSRLPGSGGSGARAWLERGGARHPRHRLSGDDAARTWVESAAWGPDGKHILIIASGVGVGVALIRNADGTGNPLVFDGDNYLAEWSPDGAHIVAASATTLRASSRRRGRQRACPATDQGGAVGRVEPRWQTHSHVYRPQVAHLERGRYRRASRPRGGRGCRSPTLRGALTASISSRRKIASRASGIQTAKASQ